MNKPTDQETYGWFNRPPWESAREPYQEVVVKFRDLGDDAKGKGKKNAGMRVKLDQPPFKSDGEMKARAANQDGYFDKEFKRVFEKEGPGRQSITIGGSKKGKDGRVKLEQPPYVPPSPGKLNSGLGNYYGTFHGRWDAFDPKVRPQGPLIFQPTNFLTSPLKKGTGYGYLDVTLNKYPKYISSPYQPATTMANVVKGKATGREKISDSPFYSTIHEQEQFDNGDCYRPPKVQIKPPKPKKPLGFVPFKQEKPFTPSNPGKKDGGCRAGGFSKWPDYQPIDKWKRIGPEYLKDERNKDNKPYVPINTTCPYSQRFNSHITQIVKKEINTHNYKTRAPSHKVYTFDTTWTRDQWNFKKGLVEC